MSAGFNIMQFATYGGAIAVLTFILTSGQKAKEFFESIGNLWLEKINLDDMVSAAVYRYCLSNMKVFGFRGRVFSGCVVRLKGRPDEQMAAFDIFKQSKMCFRMGWRWLMLKPGNWRFDPKKDDFVRSIDLHMPRFMWNSDAFLKECMKTYNESLMPKIGRQNGRFSIKRFYGANKTAPTLVIDQEKQAEHLVSGAREMLHEVSVGRARILGHSSEDIMLDETVEKDPFGWYAFPQHILDAVENARQWHRSRQWYREKRIPWRRGWLIHGVPGSGKSLLAKCLAQDLDMPVFIFDLASMNNEEFETYWSQAGMEAPCMALMEDFDAVFHGRESRVPGENKLTFDCLLNCVSGIDGGDGIFLVLTTNHLEHIDPSLGTGESDKGIPSRPGRIDEVLMLDRMDESCRRTMASRILNLSGTDLDALVYKTAGFTAAQFTEFCNRIALQMIIRPKQHEGEEAEINTMEEAISWQGCLLKDE